MIRVANLALKNTRRNHDKSGKSRAEKHWKKS